MIVVGCRCWPARVLGKSHGLSAPAGVEVRPRRDGCGVLSQAEVEAVVACLDVGGAQGGDSDDGLGVKDREDAGVR
jgi:hypothetical protein